MPSRMIGPSIARPTSRVPAIQTRIPRSPPRSPSICAKTVSLPFPAHAEVPRVLAKSPVCAFGCVELNATGRAPAVLRNASPRSLQLSLRTLDAPTMTESGTFSVESSRALRLEPGEETTVVVAFQPREVAEFLGLLEVTLHESGKQGNSVEESVGVSLVGYGGCAHAEVRETPEGIVIGNHGDRTLCLFAVLPSPCALSGRFIVEPTGSF